MGELELNMKKFLFNVKNKNCIPYDGDISILKIFSELIKTIGYLLKKEKHSWVN